MKEFIEKLIGRLEEYPGKINLKCGNRGHFDFMEVEAVKAIVNQLAEEYGKDTNVSTIDAGKLLGNEWIPISSGRLPEECVAVEVTVKEDNDNGGYDLYVFESWYQDGQWVIGKNRYNPMVTAWKPKDAPYQPKGK